MAALRKTDTALITYYSSRAKEYDLVYNRPDKKRKEEQNHIKKYLEKKFAKKDVLEIACGTGYWTEPVLKTARHITATDASTEMLAIAQNRLKKHKNVQFFLSDAYTPLTKVPAYSGAMALCWFSHIPKKNIKKFLSALHERLEKGAFVVFVDNVLRPELGGKLVKKKGSRDTYKLRSLNNKDKYAILKNYYTETQLRKIFSAYSRTVEIQYLNHFWIAGYTYGGK